MSDTVPIEHPTWLRSGDFTEADEPLRLFAAWFEDAKKAELSDPDAMALATVDADGLPNVRMVLLKGFDERGFVFYSNEESQKGRELAANPKASLAFHWKSLRRQVRLRGTVATVSAAEADAYFATRPRSSQIGAWASRQSRPLESRLAFEKAIALNAAKFALGPIPRPPFWIGYRVTPTVMEFWHDRPYRLHDRIEFRRADAAAAWTKTRLYP
ncbi:MAG TPA: pyridoxamine 5'-phosphate oxidase [Xanthobacteraceae bacterium]|jgi:pyridoxamine 5'-phosphate oxidase|nr:pyridoxamine 5'-phosphate oxidase [Xanthobacteraceae bacterium]